MRATRILISNLLPAGMRIVDSIRIESLEPPATSNPSGLDKPKLPCTRRASIEAFAASDFCAEAFGAAFRDNHAERRRAEQDLFKQCQASHITDFD